MQYGTKPEGRFAAFANAAGQRPPMSSPATGTSPSISQAGQTRGKSLVTTSSTAATAPGKIISGALSSIGQEIRFLHYLKDSWWCPLQT